jgi:hypothetical protein
MEKKCNKCGKVHNELSWKNLKHIGNQEGFDDIPSMELRNCPCGSTLAIPVNENLKTLREFISEALKR